MMWAYTVSTEPLVEESDPVAAWFARMLEVHDAAAGQAMTIRDL
jgi:hypothetical protein